jgi:hypothetical protein
MVRVGLVAIGMGLAGCHSTTEYNPFVDVDAYEVVVVEDFEGPGKSGYEFAARVTRALSTAGLFSSVVRAEPDGPALRLRGEVTDYDRGNPAMRLRYGHNIGNASFAAIVRLEDYHTGDFVGVVKLKETYRVVDRQNRILQDVDDLAERAAQDLATQLLELE